MKATCMRTPKNGPTETAASGLSAQDNVRRAFARDGFGAFVAECTHVQPIEQVFARAEHDRPLREMHLVDQPRLEIFADGRHAAADAYIAAAGDRKSVV